MNYATIEEAWAKPKGTTLNKFPVSSVKHPLVAKAEMMDEPAPVVAPPNDDEEDDFKSVIALRKALRRLFDTRGSLGIDLVLPRGYLEEQQQLKAKSPMDAFDIEEIAKWMLMAAVAYIIFDLAK